MRILERAVVAILGLATLSCRSSVETGLGSVIGNFPLVRVDGAGLPFQAGSIFTVRGQLDLRSDGRYTLTQADSAATGAVTNISSVGRWALQESAIALIDDTGPLQLGVATIDTIRMSYRGHDNVYARR